MTVLEGAGPAAGQWNPTAAFAGLAGLLQPAGLRMDAAVESVSQSADLAAIDGVDLFDRYVELPLIFIVFLRAEGWSIAAYAHKSDPGAWCVKVKKDAIVTVRRDGALTFKGLSRCEQGAMALTLDKARAAYRGLIKSRRRGLRRDWTKR